MGKRSKAREAERDRRLVRWARAAGVKVATLDQGQRWVIFAALTFLAFVGGVGPLRRLVAYLLSHCGMGLSSPVVAAVVGRTGAAVRHARRFTPREFWKRLRNSRRGHGAAKLQAEDVGPVAKFLSEHKRCLMAEVLGFIQRTFGVSMDRSTLRGFLKRYGLGCLREDLVEDTPFLPAARSTAEASS